MKRDGRLRPRRLLAVSMATGTRDHALLRHFRVQYLIIIPSHFTDSSRALRRGADRGREYLTAGDPESIWEVALRNHDMKLKVAEFFGVGEIEDHEGDAHHPFRKSAD